MQVVKEQEGHRGILLKGQNRWTVDIGMGPQKHRAVVGRTPLTTSHLHTAAGVQEGCVASHVNCDFTCDCNDCSDERSCGKIKPLCIQNFFIYQLLEKLNKSKFPSNIL